MSEYYEGKGCKCCAQSESECVCEVDWTDPEVYRLRARVDELEEFISLAFKAHPNLDIDIEHQDKLNEWTEVIE
jgi:hypothetical protein